MRDELLKIRDNLNSLNQTIDKLIKTKPLDCYSGDIKELLKSFYDDEKTSLKIIGSLLNALYCNKRQTFLLSKGMMQKIVNEDENIKIKSFSYINYKDMLHRLFVCDCLKKIRNPTNRKAGVYKLTNPDFVELLYEISKDKYTKYNLTPEQYFENEELTVVEYYDTKDKSTDDSEGDPENSDLENNKGGIDNV